MDIYAIRKANLLLLIGQQKKAVIAEKWGTSASTISQITSKKPNRNLGDALARKIEKAEGLEPGWLDWQHPASRHQEDGQPSEPAVSNIKEAPQPLHYHRYPVISRVQAGAWTECVTPYEPGAEPHEESTDYRAQGKAFWLEVQGDSMTAPPGMRPSVPEGTLVLFDTGIEAAPGKLVAALLADSNEATFKQLIEDSGQRYLKALNPAYPLIPINGNCRILGVAVEAKTRL